MARILYTAGLVLVMALGSSFSFAQWAPVSWHVEAQLLDGNEADMILTATLAPGWHIYSQHIKSGGPIPTQFRFDGGDNVALEGITLERGEPHTIHDSTYEMDVTWYSGSVVFQQRIRLLNPVKALKGSVEYMTCNDEICIPAQQEFRIPIGP